MTAEHYLKQACELAYRVARDDAGSDLSIEPPQSMRSFLYATKLPRRAITLAQQIIEEDAHFRQRVADEATEENVGSVGLLWLRRPAGWASEFDQLTSGAEIEQETTTDFGKYDPPPASRTTKVQAVKHEDYEVEAEIAATSAIAVAPVAGSNESSDLKPSTESLDSIQSDAAPSSENEIMNTPPLPPIVNTPTYLGNVAVSDQPYFPEPETDLSSFSDVDGDFRDAAEVDYESDAFESELSSLRGLVNRLKDEREHVVTGVDDGDADALSAAGGPVEDVSGLRSELESVRHELSLAQTEFSIARQEREEAQRQQSEALKRQVDLEKELSVTRHELHGIDQRAAESQTEIIGLQDQLKRAESATNDGDRSKNVLQSQLDSMTVERGQLREERSQLKGERDELLLRIADVEAKTGGADVGELTNANRSLSTELEQVTRDLERSTIQVQTLDGRLKTTTQSAETAQSEKADFSSRLADVELNLETKTAQYEAAKTDNEKLARSEGILRSERDGMQTQLSELQVSLADVLNEQADSRQVLESDRLLKSEIRGERDALLARVNAFEQADEGFATQLASVTKERDDVVVARDEAMEERGRLRGEAIAAAKERDQLQERIDSLETTQGSLATEVQAERRQREELATRILELDKSSAQDKTELARYMEERAELLESIEVLKGAQLAGTELKFERDRVQGELAEVQRRTAEDADRATVKITEMSDRMAASENERIAYQREISELKTQLQSVKVDFGELSREAAQLRLAANNPPVGLRSVPAPVTPIVGVAASVEEDQPVAASVEVKVEKPVVEELASSKLPADKSQTSVTDAEESDAEVSIFDEDFRRGISDQKVPVDKPDSAAPQVRFEPTMPISLDEVANAGGGQSGDPTWRPPTEEQVEDPWADPKAEVPKRDWNRPAAAAGVAGTAGLAGAASLAGNSGQAQSAEADELDEVGDLISQAVNRFDGDGSEAQSNDSTSEGFEEPRNIFAADNRPEGRVATESLDPSENGSLARRQIEIPNDILDDEIAVAQYVVSAPDVVLLVDGDAVSMLGWPSLPVAQQRDALVTYLAGLSTSSGAAPDVVFDGRIGGDDSLPASRSVRIRLSTPPTEPAAALDELVDAYPEQWPIALVTDDPNLAKKAVDRGATVLNNGQLLDLFIGE